MSAVLKFRILKLCSFCGSYSKSLYYLPVNTRKIVQVLSKPYSTDVRTLIKNNETIINKYFNELMVECKTASDLVKKATSSLNIKHAESVLQLLSSRVSLCDSLHSLEELKSGDSKDKELESLVQEEKDEYREQLKLLDYEIIMALIPEEPHDNVNDLVIEIKYGVGGQEAMLFAKDLFNMYCNYISYKGWTFEVAETALSEIGGLRSSSVLIYGVDAYRYLCYEGGVHRVQRVPATEKSGRIHTSTVTVAVLPQPSEIEIIIADKDLKVETKRASGAGGQHVNTTDSAVRLTHMPTGTVVECQEHRSQLKNRQIAVQRLRAKLFETEFNEQVNKMRTNRKLQVGTSGRSEKIRTYNFNQDRITDHRIGLSVFKMESFLEGGELLDTMLETLQKESELERLSELISNLKAS